ncbi:head-tail connector protein [Paenibacillus oryzisoli]|uniref:Phage gp6-like head-tail connector protein n=1 Tax=Paenibacillus oryzisoli TaxID=1850517 RepID=A0A198AI07_9BACL|nr:hypothetical protein [Paenibacillus oryzisoli]OAS21139.1 hypothetical protein A8708_30070 [Paenibacillus oryzisoli]
MVINGRDALKFKITVPPAQEPVTLDDVKTALGIELTDTIYDDQISPWIPAAREWCEGYQNRAYITQTIELAKDYWPYRDEIRLPRPPLQSVTAMAYMDSTGTATTASASTYFVDNFSEPGFLVAYSAWPAGALRPANGVIVEYVAGYGDDPVDVPSLIRQAITVLCMHWFNNGFCEPPDAVKSMLDLNRIIPI